MKIRGETKYESEMIPANSFANAGFQGFQFALELARQGVDVTRVVLTVEPTSDPSWLIFKAKL